MRASALVPMPIYLKNPLYRDSYLLSIWSLSQFIFDALRQTIHPRHQLLLVPLPGVLQLQISLCDIEKSKKNNMERISNAIGYIDISNRLIDKISNPSHLIDR